jgi:glycerophosphoryl diester phosphodiesterase
MAAFRQAIIDGADMIELDVRLTKDFHIVVHHDRNVRRTTNRKGNVWDLTLQQLRALDVGSWFHPRFERERIPTLREVMEFLLPTRVNLNIEVKTDGDPRKRAHFEECVILIIMEKRFEERSLVSSFDHKFLKRLHELFPDIKTGALYHPVRDARKKPSTLCSKIGANAFICSHAQLHQRMISNAHSHGLIIATYGVNAPKHFDEVVGLGVDAVVTDWPGKMVKQLTGR